MFSAERNQSSPAPQPHSRERNSEETPAGRPVIQEMVVAGKVDLPDRPRRLSREDGPMLSRFTRTVVGFLKDESGPTAVEYAVMLALIVVVCITAITTLGTNANNTFSYTANVIGGGS